MRAEPLFGHYPAQVVEGMQAIAGGASRNKRRQVTIKFLLPRFFTLQVARQLAADSGQQTAISLIETFAQPQQQHAYGSAFVV